MSNKEVDLSVENNTYYAYIYRNTQEGLGYETRPLGKLLQKLVIKNAMKYKLWHFYNIMAPYPDFLEKHFEPL